jgi:hypothetical protein
MFKDKTILIPFIIIGICLLSAIGIGVYKFTRPSRPAYLDSGFHIHADFKVYLNGKAIDFTQAKYQSTEAKHLDENAHLHDGNGNVMHIHKAGITLGYFVNTLGMEFKKDCFTLDTKEKFCSAGSMRLQLIVNGKEHFEMDQYVPQDLDHILITYGDIFDHPEEKQLDTVTNDACIYSKKCPERGPAPVESCVVGEPCK